MSRDIANDCRILDIGQGMQDTTVVNGDKGKTREKGCEGVFLRTGQFRSFALPCRMKS